MDDAEPGEAGVYISFGNLDQNIEIAGLEVYNFQDRIELAALPITRFSYAGRDADAAWRKQALERIEKLRTSPLSVKVVDSSGKPVKGAHVQAVMTQSAFLWGSEVDAGRVVGSGQDNELYRKRILELFDTTVIGNGLKWEPWTVPESRKNSLAAVDWLNANGKRVRGHNLVWPAWKFSPKFVRDDPERGSKIGGLVEAHIQDILAGTKGKLIAWDVVNEPIHETDYFKHIPKETIAHWFKLAEQSDPKVKLAINEYSMLNRSSSPIFIKEYLEYIAMLRKNGARIDIIGVQGHVGQTPRPPSAVLSDLDLLATDGAEVQVTEFDFNTKDEELQADYFRDFLIALYSHKAVTGFIQWGFWQGGHWKPDAAMFRKDWSEKPSVAVWKKLVLNDWKTKLDGKTPADGVVATQAHHGRYVATVAARGKTVKQEFDVTKDGASIVIKLK